MSAGLVQIIWGTSLRTLIVKEVELVVTCHTATGGKFVCVKAPDGEAELMICHELFTPGRKPPTKLALKVPVNAAAPERVTVPKLAALLMPKLNVPLVRV